MYLNKKTIAILLLLLTGTPVLGQHLTTQKVGSGAPVILLPGLTCSADVYDETIDFFSEDYEFHKITLPGFAGTKPLSNVENGFFDQTQNLILDYIKTNKIENPILIGHSLGGFLAMKIAIDNPDLPTKLVIIDALPFLPAIMSPTIKNEEQSKPMATSIKSNMMLAANQTKEERIATQTQFLSTMIDDQSRLAIVAEWGAISDPYTIAESMYELYSTDLRDQLANIKSPTLVLGSWIAYKNHGVTKESNMASYKAQYAKLKNVTIDMSETGKHFIMWDDPSFFYEWLTRFL